MNNINNLKISKIGWTSLCMKRENGKVECILVKKNLFKGYTVLNASGEKVKMTNLDSLCNLTVISHSKKMFASKEEVTSINSAFQYAHNTHIQAEMNWAKHQKDLETKLKDTEENYEKQIIEIKESATKKQRDTIGNRIDILRQPFKNTMEVEWTEEGVDIEYRQPNELQRQHFGMTQTIVRVPYSKNGTTHWGMKDYLDILETEVDNSYKPQINKLQNIFRDISTNISSLSAKYTEELYTQTLSLVTQFAIDFRSFLITYYQQYGNQELSYYKSGSSYEQNDEKTYYTQSSSKLIQQGKIACANMLENIMGTAEKDKFLAIIDEVSNTYTEESSKKM